MNKWQVAQDNLWQKVLDERKIKDKELQYANSYIYMIKCNITKEIYIGSSYSEMKKRLSDHKSDMKGAMGLLSCDRAYRTSAKVLFHNDYQHIKIEDYPCKNSQELQSRETLWILKARSIEGLVVVNARLPLLLDNESYSDLPEFSF